MKRPSCGSGGWLSLVYSEVEGKGSAGPRLGQRGGQDGTWCDDCTMGREAAAAAVSLWPKGIGRERGRSQWSFCICLVQKVAWQGRRASSPASLRPLISNRRRLV